MEDKTQERETPRLQAEKITAIKCPLVPSFRLFILALVTFGVFTGSVSFANLNFAIICMVNRTNNSPSPTSNSTVFNHDFVFDANSSINGGSGCVGSSSQTSRQTQQNFPAHVQTFHWSKIEESNVIAAFSWGAAAGALPTGWALDRWGLKTVMLVLYGFSTLATLLTPVAAALGVPLIFMCRLVIGIGHSCTFPSIAKSAACWAATNERILFIGIIGAGITLGIVVANPVNSLFCTGPGWPYLFYFWGSVGALWLLLALIFLAPDPKRSRWIGGEERNFLLSQMPPQPKRLRTPWIALLTCPAVWAIAVAQGTFMFANMFMTQYLPKYMNDVFAVTIQTNGIMSALPTLVQLTSRLVIGLSGDRLTPARCSPTLSVKFYATTGLGLAAVFLFLTTIFRCGQSTEAIVMLMLANAATGLLIPGSIKSMVLVGGRANAGVIASIAVLTAYLLNIALPYLVEVIIQDKTANSWNHAYYLAAGFAALGALTFFVFGSGDLQWWAAEVVTEKEMTSTTEMKAISNSEKM